MTRMHCTYQNLDNIMVNKLEREEREEVFKLIKFLIKLVIMLINLLAGSVF